MDIKVRSLNDAELAKFESVDDSIYVRTGGVDLAIIVDDQSTPNITYVCKAKIGSSTADPVWQIKVLDETNGYLVIKWADGDNKFDNIADNRTTLTYI